MVKLLLEHGADRGIEAVAPSGHRVSARDVAREQGAAEELVELTRPTFTCAACGRSEGDGEKFQWCSACGYKGPRYCSPACQKTDWKKGGHKKVCVSKQ